VTPDLRALPGGELVMRGLEDLRSGDCDSIEALLVQIARPRLQAAGVAVPGAGRDNAELALYARLVAEHLDDPYAAYNSLVRRLVSCAAALEHQLHRQGPTRSASRLP
jgi:hypothetical protein